MNYVTALFVAIVKAVRTGSAIFLVAVKSIDVLLVHEFEKLPPVFFVSAPLVFDSFFNWRDD